MKADRAMLEEQVKEYEGELRGLKAYVKELKDCTTTHSTQKEHFEEDLRKAEYNIKYYEDELALLREQMEKEPSGTTFAIYQDAAGEWRWQLRAANHRIIADSGEGYHNKQDCLHGIDLVKDSKCAPVKEGK